jgi:hypothetical protein
MARGARTIPSAVAIPGDVLARQPDMLIAQAPGRGAGRSRPRG